MEGIINLLEVAAELADQAIIDEQEIAREKYPNGIIEGENYTPEAQENFNRLYDKYFDILLRYQTSIKPVPIKLLGLKKFLFENVVDSKVAFEIIERLKVELVEIKDLLGHPIVNFKYMIDHNDNALDYAINTFHPQFIQIIFASLQRVDLIPKITILIEEYGKGDKV